MPDRPAPPARPCVLVLFGVGEYQSRLVRGAESVLRRNGVPLVVVAEDPALPDPSALLVHALRRHAAGGVLITPSTRAADQDRLAGLLDALGVPAVYIGEPRAGAASVTVASEPGMSAVMAHLLDDRGVRRPALIRGVVHQSDSIARERVFRAALTRRGIRVDEDLVIDGKYTYDHSFQAMSLLLQRRRDMDAVVALNDASAFGALDALAGAGLRVPDDVVVTGYDDERAAAMRSPGLTTVNQDVEGQAALAASILVAMVRGDRPPPAGLVPGRLVVRGSTAGDPPDRKVQALQEANRLLWSQLATQETLLALNRAMFRCRTVDDVPIALTSCVERLGITRCRLAVYDPPTPGRHPDQAADEVRVILDYRDHAPVVPPATRIAVSDLLAELGDRPDRTTYLMPLSSVDRDLALMAFEQRESAGSVVEVLRHDVSRALESVFGARERDRYTADLERLVAHRTRKLEHLARSDGLTRIANRSSFESRLHQEWAGHLATGRELALLMIDVDFFKAYNDYYGHVQGDEALRAVAACLEGSVRRPHDLAARYGGEEFVILLPDSGVGAARLIARRFQELLAAAAVPHAASPVAPVVTASIGIAAMRPDAGDSAQAVVHAADQSLYRAKRAGRNQMVAGALMWAGPRGA